MFNWDYFLNKWLYCFMKWHCLLNEYLSYLWTVFVASIAIYCYWTVTATVTEISVGSHVWNHYWWPSLTARSVKTYCTTLLLDVPHMTIIVSDWLLWHELWATNWITDILFKWLVSILKGHSFLTSLRICYSLSFSSLFIYIYIYVGVQAPDRS